MAKYDAPKKQKGGDTAKAPEHVDEEKMGKGKKKSKKLDMVRQKLGC